jgi:hypothetical protein
VIDVFTYGVSGALIAFVVIFVLNVARMMVGEARDLLIEWLAATRGWDR